MQAAGETVGELLRQWRQRRRLSQMALALEAEVSTRHLSYVETGRAAPSREMVLRLAEPLELPLRERNRLLLAAGFAPLFPQRPLQDPALAPALAAIRQVLAAQMPNPALAVDRQWQMVEANPMVGRLVAGCSPALLAPPVNVLRLSLHPEGLAPRIVNLAEWRAHLLARLRRQVEVAADPALAALLEELRRYPAPREKPPEVAAESIAVPLRLALPAGVLSFLSTTTVFGTPVDVTLSELAVEAFLPADPATAVALQGLHKS
ncbi:helix-turn-helix domain-containing protein [Siccirubricoccus sp. KC 17139]|uniref:Helix-turn-helix domain-containing protein n=1 Tax=Siccirubricoccus soli TaxID=2899147 RepID=A0ABT1DCQ5_9PROT|nr:helix-turn-helix domain-containing protein [Siccirubricoccus soli]MCO6418725.1 helix-turn-helix domain-containing protein [Siccirubricoccus soli]MCP2684860.1 helix-turn-helix domain-containing protein [Siccirubricoccus soli]